MQCNKGKSYIQYKLLQNGKQSGTQYQKIHQILQYIFGIMVNKNFVLSVYAVKGDDERRKANYRQTNMRYVVVVIAILVVFGCQYCFDNASALQDFIETNLANDGHQITGFQFNLLYSLYAFPNVIIPLLGGIMIDKYGARIVLIITAMFCITGHLIFGFGGLKNSFGVMLIGRVVFGVGGEVLHASQNTLISSWFKASQLSMILGICLSFPKMGSSLNSYISPLMAERFGPENYYNVAGPIFIGAIIMGISLFLAIVLAYIDIKSQKNAKTFHQSQIIPNSNNVQILKENTKKNSRSMSHRSVKLIEVSQISENNFLKQEEGQHINFKDIRKLPTAFWLILFISMLSEALFIPFLDNGNSYYVKVFGVSTSQAGIYLILPYFISSLFVIIFGYLIDKVKKRSYLLIGACSFYTLTYVFMMFNQATASMRDNQFFRWMPTFLLGICIAIFCSIIVPTVPMLVPVKLMGTGFGLMEMMQNLALGVFPLVSGVLRESADNDSKGFHRQTLFFFIISCICTGACLILKAIDVTSGRRLDIKDFRKKFIKKILHCSVA